MACLYRETDSEENVADLDTDPGMDTSDLVAGSGGTAADTVAD